MNDRKKGTDTRPEKAMQITNSGKRVRREKENSLKEGEENRFRMGWLKEECQ